MSGPNTARLWTPPAALGGAGLLAACESPEAESSPEAGASRPPIEPASDDVHSARFMPNLDAVELAWQEVVAS